MHPPASDLDAGCTDRTEWLANFPASSMPPAPSAPSSQNLHRNAFGLPQNPTPEQHADLEAAGKLTALGPDTSTPISNHAATLDFPLPRQSMSLLAMEWV